MSNNITDAVVGLETFNAVANSNSENSAQGALTMNRIIMVGGVLSGFRKEKGGFSFVDDGHDGGYRLSYADTDYLSHTVQELIRMGYFMPKTPEVGISNVAFNGSIFDHVEAGANADCLILANLFWDSRTGPRSPNPRKDQDSRNFDGTEWRKAFDKSGARVLAIVYSANAKGNYQARWVPGMMEEKAGLRLASQTCFKRTSMFGHSVELNADFFIK